MKPVDINRLISIDWLVSYDRFSSIGHAGIFYTFLVADKILLSQTVKKLYLVIHLADQDLSPTEKPFVFHFILSDCFLIAMGSINPRDLLLSRIVACYLALTSL